MLDTTTAAKMPARETNAIDLVIIVPTHNRLRTLEFTVKSLLEEHQALGLRVRVCIFDSSQVAIPIKCTEGVSVVHCPGQNFYSKQQLCLEYVNNFLPDVPWILFCPDDDIYVPTPELARLIQIVDGSKTHAYVPCRYAFFARDAYIAEVMRIREAWSHHLHIARCRLSPLERLSRFAPEGVAAYWGYFSRKGFASSLCLRTKIAQILPESSHNLIEDLSNLLSLTYDWLSLASHPFVLRGDDSRPGNSSEWRPSWSLWKDILQAGSLNQSSLKVSITLLDAINTVLPAVDKRLSPCAGSLSHEGLISLISDHTEGYRSASSRVHGISQAFLLPSKTLGSLKVQKPSFFSRDKSKQFFDILLPPNAAWIDTSLYSSSSMISDVDVVRSIYKYSDFMFSDRRC